METNGNEQKQPPTLLIQYGQIPGLENCLYNVLENRWSKVMIPMLFDQCLLPCNYGWIALLDPRTDNCSLWNPNSTEMIQLPEFQDSTFYDQCVLSKPPTEPGCHILFKSSCWPGQAFAFCQIGDDEFVKMPTTNKEYVHALKSFHGNIYALVGIGSNLKLVTISFVGKTLKFRYILKSGEPWRISPLLRRPRAKDEKFYLIDDGDEMLLVLRRSPASYLHQFSNFKIFRLDINGVECLELLDIGKRSIFLSHCGDSFCHSFVGIKPNSIYYTYGGRNLHVYNLDNRATTKLLPCLTAHRLLSTPYWIEHSFS